MKDWPLSSLFEATLGVNWWNQAHSRCQILPHFTLLRYIILPHTPQQSNRILAQIYIVCAASVWMKAFLIVDMISERKIEGDVFSLYKKPQTQLQKLSTFLFSLTTLAKTRQAWHKTHPVLSLTLLAAQETLFAWSHCATSPLCPPSYFFSWEAPCPGCSAEAWGQHPPLLGSVLPSQSTCGNISAKIPTLISGQEDASKACDRNQKFTPVERSMPL